MGAALSGGGGPAAVPEPGTLFLSLLALAITAFLGPRRAVRGSLNLIAL
jgi:hypothetical protein